MASTWQTLANVFTEVRNLSNKDSTTLPDTTLLPIANKYYYLIVRELVGLNEDIYAEISYTDLVSGQREYPLPVDDSTNYGGGAIQIQRIEGSYNNTDWVVFQPTQIRQIQTPTVLDADLNSNFFRTQPAYWFKDRSVWIAPVPDSTDYTTAGNHNLYIYWIKRPNELQNTTDIPDLPKDWLAVLQEGILYDVYRKFNRSTEASDAKQNFYAGLGRMRELEQDIDTDQHLMLKTWPKRYD